MRQCHEVPVSKARPAWFSKAAATASILAELDAKDCIVVFDTTGGAVPPHVISAAERGARVFAGRFGSDRRSMAAATRVALEQGGLSDDDVLYFVEDDYVHRPGWLAVLREAFEHDVADYVTLYDHPDKYDAGVYPHLQCRMTVTPSSHWRSTPSTTNTWAVRLRRLRADLGVHQWFTSAGDDHEDHNKFVALAAGGARVASSVPGWSAHCQAGCLSPVLTWGPPPQTPR